MLLDYDALFRLRSGMALGVVKGKHKTVSAGFVTGRDSQGGAAPCNAYRKIRLICYIDIRRSVLALEGRLDNARTQGIYVKENRNGGC